MSLTLGPITVAIGTSGRFLGVGMRFVEKGRKQACRFSRDPMRAKAASGPKAAIAEAVEAFLTTDA